MKPLYSDDNFTLYCGDCLKVMPHLSLEGLKFDLCLTDPPFGVTACHWDKVIDVTLMWENLHWLIKKRASVLLFATQPFSSRLVNSNFSQYKYSWYWKKSNPTTFVHAKNRPMSIVEEICVFSQAPLGHVSLLGDRRMHYYPQGVKPAGVKIIRKSQHSNQSGARPNQVGREYLSYTGFDHHLLEYGSVSKSTAIHPTQKPVELLAYLIKCYTKPNELVLDFAAGSGSLAEACAITGRKCVLIEMDEIMCEKILKRMEDVEWKN